MKNRNFVKNSMLVLLPISLGLGVLLGINKKSAERVDGYSTSSLPTTIDLNDTTAANIRSYYSSLNNKSESERQGTNLLKNLKTILKTGQKYYSYDSGNAIWQIYEIADRDWEKSPASSTKYGTYNSSTKKITNYTYGTSASSSKNNPYIHALYINRSVTNQTTAWDDHQQTQWGINREHVWPKAEGFEESGSGGARGDPMHLMAGNGYANNIHSNYYYGYVNTSSSYTNCGSKYSNLSGNLLGKSKTLGGSTKVFEPQDSDKGDIARAIFYMVARYNYYSGSDSDGIDSNNPNLILTQSLSDWSSTGYSSTASKSGKMGIMTDLLAWHHADPVDQFEIHRNNILYSNFTNNRNPFIDFPEWADFIWGSVNYSGSTYKSHSTTPTGYATPSSDTINGYNSGSGETIPVTGISLDTNSTSVEAGKDVTLTPIISPSNATNQGVIWTTSDSNIATVSGGIVTGVSEGSCTITATSSDKGFTASCTVTVSASESGGEEDTIVITKATSGASGNSYDGGAERTWTQDGYDFGSKATCASGDNIQVQGSNGVIYNTVKFNAPIASITVNQTTSAGWTLYGGTSGRLVNNVAANYTVNGGSTDGVTSPVASTKMKWTISDEQNYTYFALKRGGSASYVSSIEIEFKEASVSLSSIAVKTSPTKLSYNVGDDFSPIGLVITATYSDSSNLDIPFSGNEDAFDFEPYDNLQTTDSIVTITYGGKTCSQSISVASAKTLSSISINTDNVKKSFETNEVFSYTGLVVTANFSDSTSAEVSSVATVSNPDMSTAGNKTITISYSYGGIAKTASYSISVVEASGATDTTQYSLITSTSELDVGKSYIITNGTSGTVKSIAVTTNTNNRKTTDITISNSKITRGSSVMSFILGGTSGAYTFETENYTDTNGYLASSANTSGNYLRVVATPGTATISFSDDAAQINLGPHETRTLIQYNPNNGSPIFACYSGSQQPVYLWKEIDSSVPLTTISAAVSKAFSVGEIITTSDITVSGNNGQIIIDFAFSNNNYQFTYNDAASGGGETQKAFVNCITYLDMSCSLTVSVKREEYIAPENETITLSSSAVFNGIGGGNKDLKSGTVSKDGITYLYSDAYYYSGGSALSFGNASNQTGYLINQTGFERGIADVTVSSTGRAVNIRYSTDGNTWVLKADSNVSDKTYKYFKLDCVGNTGSNYSNITVINIKVKGGETASNVANYIMLWDTEGQCDDKFETAELRFNNMSVAERASFMTSDDYVLSTARTRLTAWAKHFGKTIALSEGDYVVQNSSNINALLFNDSKTKSTGVIALVVAIGVMSIGGYFFMKSRRKEEF